MQTLKLKAQPTNAFSATVNQMFGCSSQLPTTVEHVVIKSLCTIQRTNQCSVVVGSWEEPPNAWLTAAKNAFVWLSFELWRPRVIGRRSKMKPRREIKLPSSNEYLCFQTYGWGTWSSRCHSHMAFLVVEIINQRWLIKFPWISVKWPFLLRVPLT